MTRTQIISLVLMATLMVVAAMAMGRWAEQINPGGIAQHPTAQSDADVLANNTSQTGKPRDAYTFGASLGLLGMSLLYCCIAFGLLIKARSQGVPASGFIYCIAAFAAVGFALSYGVDDYFI